MVVVFVESFTVKMTNAIQHNKLKMQVTLIGLTIKAPWSHSRSSNFFLIMNFVLYLIIKYHRGVSKILSYTSFVTLIMHDVVMQVIKHLGMNASLSFFLFLLLLVLISTFTLVWLPRITNDLLAGRRHQGHLRI